MRDRQVPGKTIFFHLEGQLHQLIVSEVLQLLALWDFISARMARLKHCNNLINCLGRRCVLRQPREIWILVFPLLCTLTALRVPWDATRNIRCGWTIRHRTLHTRARIMSRGRISSRPAQKTGAAAFSWSCKGPAQCRAGRARELLGTKGGTHSAGEGRGTPHAP